VTVSTEASFSLASDFLRALSSMKSFIMLIIMMTNSGGAFVGLPPDIEIGLIICKMMMPIKYIFAVFVIWYKKFNGIKLANVYLLVLMALDPKATSCTYVPTLKFQYGVASSLALRSAVFTCSIGVSRSSSMSGYFYVYFYVYSDVALMSVTGAEVPSLKACSDTPDADFSASDSSELPSLMFVELLSVLASLSSGSFAYQILCQI